MRLIDADKLLAMVKKNAPFIYHIILPIVALTHTEDAEPVRHGEWIVESRSKFPFDGVSIKCSLCGRYEYKKEPYCHCGAKMDGGKQDADNSNDL